jgi:hypothetical protein
VTNHSICVRLLLLLIVVVVVLVVIEYNDGLWPSNTGCRWILSYFCGKAVDDNNNDLIDERSRTNIKQRKNMLRTGRRLMTDVVKLLLAVGALNFTAIVIL